LLIPIFIIFPYTTLFRSFNMKNIVYLIAFCLMFGDFYQASSILTDLCNGKWPLSSFVNQSRGSTSVKRVSPFMTDQPNPTAADTDRKSTRLNSSHVIISY